MNLEKDYDTCLQMCSLALTMATKSRLRGLSCLKKPNYPFDFHDHSLEGPVKDKSGRPIKYPPSDARSKPVRDEINSKFKNASKLLVLIGSDTSKSDWVKWEIDTFIEMKAPLSGKKSWKRISGVKLKGYDASPMPSALMNGRSTKELA